MSSNKRRKLEPGVPSAAAGSAVSAISALAARRRQAGQPLDKSTSQDEPAEEATLSKKPNPFDVLSSLSRQQSDQVKSQARSAVASPRVKSSPGPGALDEDGQRLETLGTDARIRTTPYSSFRLTKKNHRVHSNGSVELRLEASERFIVLGSFGIKVLEGEVTVFGATLRPSDKTYRVHAPLCYAVPVFRTTKESRLTLSPDVNALGLRDLDVLSPLFRRLWNESTEGNAAKQKARAKFQIVCTPEDVPKRSIIQELVSPPEWNKKLASLTSSLTPPRAFICGPKSAGKSTLSKLLTNRLTTKDNHLNSVAVLDLDPGQPEYTPSGTLALTKITDPTLGPPFAHTSFDGDEFQVLRCHALAAVTPSSAPEHFLACAVDLLETYRSTLSSMPLIINTPGWILGTGLDLLAQLIGHTSPTEVIYLSEDGPLDTVEVLRGASQAAASQFTLLPSQQSEFSMRTAAHLRAMQMMAYFHSTNTHANIHSERGIGWDSKPLSAVPPWQIKYAGPKRGILAVLSYDFQTSPELLAETINGMVLAVVVLEDSKALGALLPRAASKDDERDADQATAKLEELVSRSPEGMPYIQNPSDLTLDPAHSRTIGLILIRGIDTKSQTLQVLTPIPQSTITDFISRGHRLVLVHGNFDAPHWAYTEDLYAEPGQADDGESSEDEDWDESMESRRDGKLSGERLKGDGRVPWVEILQGNEKRPVGSRVWRVRRDLGRSGGD